MGAAFNDDLVRDVATVISTEARAFNNDDRAGTNENSVPYSCTKRLMVQKDWISGLRISTRKLQIAQLVAFFRLTIAL